MTLAAPGLWAMVMVHLGAALAVLPAARPTNGVLMLALATFVVRNFCISAGFHRYFAHRSFTVGRTVQFLFAFVGGMAVMRSALWWAAHHRQHHRCADHAGDPHSPREGFWWAHLKWFMVRGSQRTRVELVEDLSRFPELRWLDRHEWVPILFLMAFCYAVAGFPGWVWGANVSTLVLCHVTFALNSVTHRFGHRTHETTDDSRDLLPLALATFGEGWHNTHHRFPARARIGEAAWQIDISWWGIRLMEFLSLAREVRR